MLQGASLWNEAVDPSECVDMLGWIACRYCMSSFARLKVPGLGTIRSSDTVCHGPGRKSGGSDMGL